LEPAEWWVNISIRIPNGAKIILKVSTLPAVRDFFNLVLKSEFC
jgi:hypothetical protein